MQPRHHGNRSITVSSPLNSSGNAQYHQQVRCCRGATAVTTGLGFASPASAQVATAVLDFGDGTLLAKGAAVNVPVTFTCAPSLKLPHYMQVAVDPRASRIKTP